MSYLPSVQSMTKEIIITLVGIVVAHMLINKIPALKNAINPD